MVPSSYHAFFSGAVTATGALIGLLFVAISVDPHRAKGERAATSFELKAGLAFSVFVDALILSLYALLPGKNLATAGLVLALVGISSVLGLAGLALRDGEIRRIALLVRFLGLLAVYSVQLAESLKLGSRPHSTGPVSADCTLVVVCILIGIDRSWDLIGQPNMGLVKIFVHRFHRAQARARDERDGETSAVASSERDETS